MAKAQKIKTKAGHVSAATKKTLPEKKTLEELAAAFYAEGDYKNALLRYERLYKENPQPLTKEALINSLLARAKQLQVKHFYAEASAVFAHLKDLAAAAVPFLDYLFCLIQARSHEKAILLYQDHFIDTKLIPQELVLWIFLYVFYQHAASALFEEERQVVEAVFAELDTVASHIKTKDAAILTVANKISLLSPLRDIRILMQALMLFHANPGVSLEAAKKIKASSPVFLIAKVIILANKTPLDIFYQLPELSKLQLSLLQRLKGWSDQQLKTLIAAFQVFIQQKNIAKKILFVVKMSDALPQALREKFCFSLYDAKPQTSTLISQHFAAADFCKMRMEAIVLEKDNNPRCLDRWDRCIEIIKKTKSMSLDLIGFIKLHQYQVFSSATGYSDERSIQWLINSLDYLPKRKATYEQICQYYIEKNKKKEHLLWLNRMQKIFPDDLSVIMNIANLSLERKTFSKAIKALNAALVLDSINIQAKQLLARAYLEKTFYEIAAAKYKQAEKDLLDLKQVKAHLSSSALIYIAEALLLLKQGNIPLMQEILDLAYKSKENILFINYLFYHYSILLKIPLTTKLGSYLCWNSAESSAKNIFYDEKLANLLAFLRETLHFIQSNKLKTWFSFKKSAVFYKEIAEVINLKLSVDAYARLCDLLLQLGFYEALILVAKAGLKIDSASYLFEHYCLQGKIKGDISNMDEDDYYSLMDLYESAPSAENKLLRDKAQDLMRRYDDDIEGYDDDINEDILNTLESVLNLR